MIVDTSVWIDFLRDVRDARTDQVAELILQNGLLYITPTILQEVLQGIHVDNQFKRIKRSLLAHPVLQIDPIEAAVEAATIYRFLRKKGVTIRKPNDCLIAHYAIFYDIPILHNDADFDQIARFTSLRIAQV
ncbi:MULTISPECIES: PIN domain nuclease [unclassified Spirosoma]|uniref:type II toxin-antitoxin system VapC family toxin n=1 Tax=unclassified Spirosoma TaxID=2621999 RepID=UPI0009596055|nr:MULTISPECIES: PIN domain nuclease [unclassified Spirosoma]MBN8825325.1 PIN domain nuclease [Spirosoma sp.]OJW77505.1 MAG: VapC toxin family PIN domain ribonuclease [Spirosoma sp. 48-14]